MTRRSGRPVVAAVTMVRNEGWMLRRWIDHYGAQLGMDHLVVVDDRSDDGSTDGLPCRVIQSPPHRGDFERGRMRFLSKVAADLLRTHDAVMHADADEFLVADPKRYDDLPAFLQRRDHRPVVAAMGLNVVHHLAGEGALDPARPILGQRRLATFVPLMCKPAVKRVPNRWMRGSHGIAGMPYMIDPRLYLFHMKFVDRDHLRRTAELRHDAARLESRAPDSSWQHSADDMVTVLDEINDGVGADVSRIEEFRPPVRELARIVKMREGGFHLSVGLPQVEAMAHRPLRRIPERFHGIV